MNFNEITSFMKEVDALADRMRDEVMPLLAKAVGDLKMVDTDIVVQEIKLLQDRIIDDAAEMDELEIDSEEWQECATSIVLGVSIILDLQERTAKWITECCEIAAREEAERAV